MRRAALILCVLAACSEDSATRVMLTVRLAGLQLDQLELSATSSELSFPKIRRPELAATPLLDPQSVAVLFADEIADHELLIEVAGLWQSQSMARAKKTIIPVARQTVSSEIWLSGVAPDGGVDGGSVDGSRDGTSREGGSDQRRDASRVDAKRDALRCTPDLFVSCSGTQLDRCNKSGDALLSESCAPYLCNTAAKRCNQCDPAAPPKCQGAALISCTAEGLSQSVPCPLGCSGQSCCTDADQDQVSSCSGDCDDSDPQVHVGQPGFFTSPAKNGGYDYNCDKVEERENGSEVSCVRVGTACQGHGWLNTVPGCGQGETFVVCQPSGMNSCSHVQSTKTQACR